MGQANKETMDFKTDMRPLDDFFTNDASVESMSDILERKIWELVMYELNDEIRDGQLASDIWYLHRFIDALRYCKTLGTDNEADHQNSSGTRM